MSRSTQYIGLTDRAHRFLKEHDSMMSCSENRCTKGMFEEDIPLGTWRITLRKTSPTLGEPADQQHFIVREVVQAEPWSSGPMIFTCLEFDFGQGDEDFRTRIFQWIEDPTLWEEEYPREFDSETGRFWV